MERGLEAITAACLERFSFLSISHFRVPFRLKTTSKILGKHCPLTDGETESFLGTVPCLWVPQGQASKLWFDAVKGIGFLGSKPNAPGGPRGVGVGRGGLPSIWDATISHGAPSHAQVKDVDGCVFDSHRPSKPCVEQEKWAYKLHPQPPGLSARATVDANLRRNLMSAPPVMRQHRDKEPAKPVPLKVATPCPHNLRRRLGQAWVGSLPIRPMATSGLGPVSSRSTARTDLVSAGLRVKGTAEVQAFLCPWAPITQAEMSHHASCPRERAVGV